MNYKKLLRILSGASFEKLFIVIDNIKEKTGKWKISLFFDIIWCAVRYGAGYNDYDIFEFYNCTSAERKTYLTRIKNQKFIELVNDEAYSDIFDDKNIFSQRFKKFLHRDVIDLTNADFAAFEIFLRGKDYVVAKPSIGEGGKGIEIIKISDFPTAKTLFDYLKAPEKNFGIAEEKVVQHLGVAAMHPASLNCLRIITLLCDGEAHILHALFKVGAGGNMVDNMSDGGFAANVDVESGVVIAPAHTLDLRTVDVHPESGIRFEGFKIPLFKEAKSLVKEAALVVPQIKYVGWDVCITPDGPAIIEGNDFSAHDFPQLPDAGKPRCGLLPKLKKFGYKL